ncbi:MAG: helix-turn-helix transcriptional regulator, partial [Flavobacteriaceae bacterium]|nr:helix-turn-helix transcriptional regulator [Flavobacteriaceae bacterium]
DYSWKESKQGPPRKYYVLTKEGIDHLKELNLSWIEVDKAVKKIINTKK